MLAPQELNAGVKAFLALDSGRVNGPSVAYLVGRSLTGAALGLRGTGNGLFYEVFVATPLSKPAHFQTAHHHFSFSHKLWFLNHARLGKVAGLSPFPILQH